MAEVKKEVSMGIITRISGEIKIGDFGACMLKNNQSNGYNIFKWESTCYTSQNDIKNIKQGELIINESVLNKRINWYTSTTGNTIIQLHQVFHPDKKMEQSSENSEYPSQYKKNHVRVGQLLIRISDNTHAYILNEISWQDLIEFDEFSWHQNYFMI